MSSKERKINPLRHFANVGLALALMQGPTIDVLSRCDYFEHEGELHSRIVMEIIADRIPLSDGPRWFEIREVGARKAIYLGDLEPGVTSFRRVIEDSINPETDYIIAVDGGREEDLMRASHRTASCDLNP